MGTLWILIANSSYAKLFEVKGHGRHIKEIQHIENPEGRMKSGDLLSDRPGRTFDRMGAGRHALGTEVDPHAHELQVFAGKLAHLLYEANVNHSYDELGIVAPPQFLGVLNQSLDEGVRKSVFKEVNKDLPAHLSEQERIKHLCEYFELWNHKDSHV